MHYHSYDHVWWSYFGDGITNGVHYDGMLPIPTIHKIHYHSYDHLWLGCFGDVHHNGVHFD